MQMLSMLTATTRSLARILARANCTIQEESVWEEEEAASIGVYHTSGIDAAQRFQACFSSLISVVLSLQLFVVLPRQLAITCLLHVALHQH